jgi:deoxyribonuclease V
MRKLHEWNLSYAEARRVQVELAGRVEFVPWEREPEIIAGLDCAFSGDGKWTFAAAIVLRVIGLRREQAGPPERFEFEQVETVTAEQETRFPYIPGLLSFREAPVCLEAVAKLKWQPDLFMIDGQGIAHPRRLEDAIRITLACATKYRIPEPTRLAHQVVSRAR